MPENTCTSPECDRPAKTRGYCRAHYLRLFRGMDPNAPLRDRSIDTLRQRLFADTVTNELGCVLRTTGHKGLTGFGSKYTHLYWHKYKRQVGSHRIAWELAHGPIPEGLTIDYLCRQPACINVDHLEIVTQAENTLRGTGRHVSAAHKRARTHCIHGHQFTPANTGRDKNGWRHCKTCAKASQKRIAAKRNATRRAAREAARNAA